MSVTKRLRFEILTRDGNTCRYCGAQAPDVKLTIDHVIPVALGGGDESSNLVTACKDCNAGKSSMSPDGTVVEQVKADALRWADAMATAAAIEAREREADSDITREFDALWNAWTTEPNWRGDTYQFEMPANWETSVLRWISLGLDMDTLEAMIRVAMTSNAAGSAKWSYFAGCCWRRLKERQQMARDILNDADGEPE